MGLHEGASFSEGFEEDEIDDSRAFAAQASTRHLLIVVKIDAISTIRGGHNCVHASTRWERSGDV